MGKEEIESAFTKELFDKMQKMIEEKKMSMENVIVLLKRMGYCKTLKKIWIHSFEKSFLNKRFEKMIVEEEKKKDEEKHEILLVDLCECYLLLSKGIPDELLSICMSCLLKVATKNEKNDEVLEEVEVALLALSCINMFCNVPKELYLSELKEIIKHHQEHHNLTRLAYQCIWEFLINRLIKDENLEDVALNELHFVREARRELKDLTGSADWKGKEEGEKGGRKEAKEVLVIKRWLLTLICFLYLYKLLSEELTGLFGGVVSVFRAAKDNCVDVSSWCTTSLRRIADIRAIDVDVSLKKGIVDLFSGEMKQSSLNDEIIKDGLFFFFKISGRLKEKTDNEAEKMKRKATKMEMFEKMEEEGFEDSIVSLYGEISFLNKKYKELSKNLADYFVNA
ncbi:uncharacterized protein MONOS_5310 [Monocercomonoides exilis]|uniref:uncharacterized protein n=1 Tax=Monocercomonoides exilis TaxID=2049356 RepID=UPI00355A9406|nr:hypothetical protein MONOS_5310 [Monocercomonoides exilis]|eukprot:MONOS_5310.1-p1 / transcript=MONOS_5310.1 / gene=MONOS_5310 / organism=Monocercomonoides_exilis_PA203 / gene_product=unspecified product / transcript_product=unspecified product / location=Mono_scaffold00153:22919-24157(-) / protein_length=395 / sequence_SO=supercontig / SO=protein_coding / is_pseudo=false